MSGLHAFLPPSGAAAWEQCALWPTMNRLYPQDDTPETLEGTAAHEVLEDRLNGIIHPVGAPLKNGQFVTEEMIDGAELAFDAVHSFIKLGQPIVIERSVAIQNIHPNCWGTPDIWSFDASAGLLDVIDYKFGHRFVDEFDNAQGVSYVLGIIDEIAAQYGISAGTLDQNLTVRFTVVQPRCFYRGAPVRTWTFKASDIRGHVNQLRMAAELAHDSNPVAKTNSECQYCPGRHVCPTLQKAAYSDAELAMKSSPLELPPEAAALELRMLERSLARLSSRVTGLQQSVLSNLRSGVASAYYHIEHPPGRQKWATDDKQIIAIGQLYGIDLAKVSAITPKQALKLGVDEAVINAYSVTPSGEAKLIPNDPKDASRVFGNNF